MTLKFNLMAAIEVPNADEFPPKEVVEKSIAEILEFEGMISHELAVTHMGRRDRDTGGKVRHED